MAGCPCRTRGVPLGRGSARCEGDPPLGRGPLTGRAARGRAPGLSRARRGPGTRRRSRSCVARSRGARCSRSSTGTAGARTRGYAGDPGRARGPQGGARCGAPGGARWDKCGGAGAARGRGSGLGRPVAPERGSEGRRAAAPAAAGLRHAAPRPGREGEEGGRAARSQAGQGLGPPGRGGEDPARGRGRGRAGRAGPQESGRLCARARQAGSDGHGRRSLAPLLFPRSLPHTRAEGGEARSSHFPTFQTSQRNFPLLPARASSSISLPPPFASSAPGRGFRARPPEGAWADIRRANFNPLRSGLHWPGRRQTWAYGPDKSWSRKQLERDGQEGSALPDWLEAALKGNPGKAGIYNFVS